MRNTYAKISLDAIRANFSYIKNMCGEGVKICPVIKADAYGHGMVRVAHALADRADYFAVALLTEGKKLRDEGIKNPILVLAAVDEDEIADSLRNNLTITVSSIEKLEIVVEKGKLLSIVPKVHLKIDTGMNRIGVHWNRVKPFIDRAHELVKSGAIICEGIYSHFSDSMDKEFTKIQFDRFSEVLDYAKKIGMEIPLSHIASSRSIFLYPEYRLTMVRPGISLYGIEPEYESSMLPREIIPALEWKTKVVYFKVIEKGENVGYGRTYTAKEDYERVITLPVGYADGFPRRLSNSGHILVRGKKYPIVGRVCMDQIIVSLGKDGEAYLGDVVTLLGTDGEHTISAEDISRAIDTTPHEITTCISERVPRVY